MTENRNKFLLIKPTDAQFQVHFGNTTLHVSGSLPVHHQKVSTVQPALEHLCRFDDLLLALSWSSVLTLQARDRQTCIKCANAGCTEDTS